MPLTTSSKFASVIETGTDWRDISKKILEQLESIRTQGSHFNVGFLYVSDELAADISSITDLFKSVLGINNWVGSVGMGVCGNGIEHVNKAAISVMVGQFEEDSFKFYNQHGDADNRGFNHWMGRYEPLLALIHANPTMYDNPLDLLELIDEEIGGFTVGGMSSSRSEHAIISPESLTNDINCLVFSSDLPVVTTLSQGCSRIGPVRRISRCYNNKIYEIDDKPALDVFEKDLADIATKNAERILGGQKEQSAISHQNLINGEIHAAIPISGSDQGNYLVRNFSDVDETERSIEIAYPVTQGSHILFVNRDDESVSTDLSKQILSLRERIQKSQGNFTPKGGIYISCVARAFTKFDSRKEGGEMALIRNIIGDVPLTGYYASGEIYAAQLYSYTGILILFL